MQRGQATPEPVRTLRLGTLGRLSLLLSVALAVGESPCQDVVPFVQALAAAAGRRVIIGLRSVPTPMLGSEVYELMVGGPDESPPGHRELLAVLLDLGILPEVRVLPMPMRQNYVWSPEPTRDRMLGRALNAAQRLGAVDPSETQTLLDEHFDELLVHDATGYWPHGSDTVRELLITWETGDREL